MYSIKDFIISILIMLILIAGLGWQWQRMNNDSLILENARVKVEAKVDAANMESKDLSDDLKQLKDERVKHLKKAGKKNEEVNLTIGTHTTIFGGN